MFWKNFETKKMILTISKSFLNMPLKHKKLPVMLSSSSESHKEVDEKKRFILNWTLMKH